MKKNLILVLVLILLSGLGSALYYDLFHNSVENIDELIGKNYDYARNIYFKREPDVHYKKNVKVGLNEFDGGILSSKVIFSDSMVHVYTWNYNKYKKTIWVGQTSNMRNHILDAIRYKNNVRF